MHGTLSSQSSAPSGLWLMSWTNIWKTCLARYAAMCQGAGSAKSRGHSDRLRDCHVSLLACMLHVPCPPSLQSLEREWSSMHARPSSQSRGSEESPADHRLIRRSLAFETTELEHNMWRANKTNQAIVPTVTMVLTRCLRLQKCAGGGAWTGRDAPHRHAPTPSKLHSAGRRA